MMDTLPTADAAGRMHFADASGWARRTVTLRRFSAERPRERRTVTLPRFSAKRAQGAAHRYPTAVFCEVCPGSGAPLPNRGFLQSQ